MASMTNYYSILSIKFTYMFLALPLAFCLFFCRTVVSGDIKSVCFLQFSLFVLESQVLNLSVCLSLSHTNTPSTASPPRVDDDDDDDDVAFKPGIFALMIILIVLGTFAIGSLVGCLIGSKRKKESFEGPHGLDYVDFDSSASTRLTR
jgi:hypothetical protein